MPVEIKSHKKYILVKITISLILSITSLYVTLLGFLKIKDFIFDLDYELQNWESNTIDSINLNLQECSKNNMIGFNYTWPGSKNSCDCRFSDEYTLSLYGLKKVVYWQVCTVDMFRSSCKKIRLSRTQV